MGTAEQKLRETIAQTARCDASSLTLDDDVVEKLGLDSLAALRLLAAVEKHFGVRFPDEQLSEFRTMRRILDWLSSRTE